MTPSALHRYRAERLLRKDFAGLRSKVLAVVRAQLRGKGVTLDASDLEACYAQAWHGLYATVLEGAAVENPSAWLVLVTFRRAIDESRAAGRIGVLEEGIGSFPRTSDASAEGLADELDNRARLRHVFEGMRATLSKRECEAASLCYLQGLTRAEAAERMGIGEARMRKLMEGAGPARPGVAGKVSGLLDTIKAGGWCEQQSSLMRAFAFGVLDPGGERHALATAHCRECPACRAYVASLRGLASVLPLPLLSRLALAGAATGGGTFATRIAATRLRFGGWPTGSWSGLAGSLTAKLAVTAFVLLGAGYALLGSRAHGSPPGRRGASAAAPAPLSQAAFPVLGAPAQWARSTRSSTARKHSLGKARSTRGATAGEFSPERVHREQAIAPPGQAALSVRSQSSSSRAAREFGIE
jgi:DNA-directed RNA polymerase specialized sigma24 family protein